MIEAKIMLTPETAKRFRRFIDGWKDYSVSEAFEAVLLAGMKAIQSGAQVPSVKREEQKDSL